MVKAIIFSFLGGVIVYIATAIFLGKKKTNKLPGGAISSGFAVALLTATPLWIGPLVALVAHLLTVLTVKIFTK